MLVLSDDWGVDLCCGNVIVTNNFLSTFQIGTRFRQSCRNAVAKSMAAGLILSSFPVDWLLYGVLSGLLFDMMVTDLS